MSNQSYKALLSDRYKVMSNALFNHSAENALFAQEVATVLREARQPESVILAAMVATSSLKAMLAHLESWERKMACEAMELLEKPEFFASEKDSAQNDTLKVPSREASDIVASILLVMLRRQLERSIRNEDASQAPQSFALPFYGMGKAPLSAFEAEKDLESVFCEYEKRLQPLNKSPIAHNVRAYLKSAMKRCHCEPPFSYDDRPVYRIQGDLLNGMGAQIWYVIRRAGFYIAQSSDKTEVYVSCRADWAQALNRLMVCVVTAYGNEVKVTLCKTVKFSNCKWRIEPVHSYEWVKVFERQKIQQLLASSHILNPLKAIFSQCAQQSNQSKSNPK